MHGLLTKTGMRSTPQFRFLSAFVWSFIFFSAAYYYYYTFIQPC